MAKIAITLKVPQNRNRYQFGPNIAKYKIAARIQTDSMVINPTIKYPAGDVCASIFNLFFTSWLKSVSSFQCSKK